MQGEISNEKIKKYIDFMWERPNLPPTIYHYTGIENIDKIFMNEGLSFRMSEMKDFSDKLEGQTIEAYYDAALDRLERRGVISESDRMKLDQIRIPKCALLLKGAESDEELSIDKLIHDTARVFVCCFSRNQMDAYMVDHYIKNEAKAGYSIGVFTRHLNPPVKGFDMFTGGIWQIVNITYGEDTISYFEDFLTELLELTGGVGTREYEIYGRGIIASRLQERQYATKLGKFRHENEVRAILLLPENHMQQLPNGITLCSDCERTYSYVRLEHYAVNGIYRTSNVSPQKDKEIRDQLKNRHFL